MTYKIAVSAIVLAFLVPALCRGQASIRELEGKRQTSPHDIKTLIDLGTLYHRAGADGDENAVEKGFGCFDTILALDPASAVAHAYRGSLWTMRGRDASDPLTKVRDVDMGDR